MVPFGLRYPLLLTLLAGFMPWASAQPQPSDRVNPSVRSEAARDALQVGNRYYEVPPGQYWIVAMHSGKCLGVAQRPNGSHYISAETCRFDGPDKGPLVAVVKQRPKHARLPSTPSALFGFYPSFSLRPVATGSELLTRCAQVAEGVVLGAPGIDVEACRSVSGERLPDVGVTEPCAFGSFKDQAFVLQRVSGRDGYMIRTGDRSVPIGTLPHTHTRPHCVDVREGSTADGAEHINFACGPSQGELKFNQVFRFIPEGPLPTGLASCGLR